MSAPRRSCAPQNAGPEVETSAPPRRSTLTPTVLVVDDVDDNRTVLAMMVEMAGCQVERAASGAEALAAVRRRGFDLVLMDVAMPGCDGRETTRYIRDIGVTASTTPIVAVTASVSPETEASCLDAGMQAYLPKPVTFADLRSCIDRWAAHA